MEKEFRKASGICLVTGSILLVLTMVLHPSGGDIAHILRIKNIIMISHAMAISSLPLLVFGFWGLSIRLYSPGRISILAFIITCFGLVAAMMAATVNGLTLPLFLSAASGENFDAGITTAIRQYGNSLNIPMDYVMICTITISIGIWSVIMIRRSQFPNWIGYYGLFLIFLGVIAWFFKLDLAGLFGFRIFIFGIVSWIITTAFKLMIRTRE